jgi:hypothetical protein
MKAQEDLMGPQARPARHAIAAGVMSLALAGALSACGTSASPGAAGTSTTAPTTSGSTGSPATTSASTPVTGKPISIPVYWIAESRRSFALYREFREVPDVGGPIASAVSAMTRLHPLDPDYMTPWRPASRVTASQSGQAITVDLSGDAFANHQVGSELAGRAVQQLVYTATAAAQQARTPASSVRITVDGAAFDAWGVVRLGEPIQRAPMAAVQAQAWVTSPQEGEELPAGTVTFKGFGTAFEANFVWEIRNAAGAKVANGFTMGGSDGTFGELTFSAKLTPGTYSVEVSSGDASGGAEGPGAAVDDKTFTVR